jgi:hypothetical protein
MNCKPGDLALVNSNPFVENLGAVITVTEWLGTIDAHCVNAWLCSVDGRPLLGMHKGKISSSDKHGNVIVMPDQYLRPVSGLPLTIDDYKELTEEV